MELKWQYRTRVPYSELTAEVTEDTGEYSAIITGEIVDAPRAGDSDVPDRIIKNKKYGPVTVHASSLEELKWFVEERIESDVGQLIGSPDD
jgi:hypothetical protein